jgi:hypothetical protein
VNLELLNLQKYYNHLSNVENQTLATLCERELSAKLVGFLFYFLFFFYFFLFCGYFIHYPLLLAYAFMVSFFIFLYHCSCTNFTGCHSFRKNAIENHTIKLVLVCCFDLMLSFYKKKCLDLISSYFEDNFVAYSMNNSLKIGTAIKDMDRRS